jgi:hypothetical protein
MTLLERVEKMEKEVKSKEWKELKKDMSGQPFYKKSSAKDRY